MDSEVYKRRLTLNTSLYSPKRSQLLGVFAVILPPTFFSVMPSHINKICKHSQLELMYHKSCKTGGRLSGCTYCEAMILMAFALELL